MLLEKNQPDFVLRQFVHERKLLSEPLKVEVPREQKATYLSPDSWLDIGQKSTRRRYCFCVEVNLTEINQRRWLEIVRKYLYCLPSYKERFGTDILTVAVSVQSSTDFPVTSLTSLTPDEIEERKREAKSRTHRLKNLVQWTEAGLQAQNRRQDADMFRFSAASLDQLTYKDLFFSRHWKIPTQESFVSLLAPAGKEDVG